MKSLETEITISKETVQGENLCIDGIPLKVHWFSDIKAVAKTIQDFKTQTHPSRRYNIVCSRMTLTERDYLKTVFTGKNYSLSFENTITLK
jgi:hypothetical protein